MADKSDRKQHGPDRPWSKGISGNPSGRALGSRKKATLLAQEMIDGRGPELVKPPLDLAASGDTAMLRLFIERLVLAKKRSRRSGSSCPR